MAAKRFSAVALLCAAAGVGLRQELRASVGGTARGSSGASVVGARVRVMKIELLVDGTADDRASKDVSAMPALGDV